MSTNNVEHNVSSLQIETAQVVAAEFTDALRLDETSRNKLAGGIALEIVDFVPVGLHDGKPVGLSVEPADHSSISVIHEAEPYHVDVGQMATVGPVLRQIFGSDQLDEITVLNAKQRLQFAINLGQILRDKLDYAPAEVQKTTASFGALLIGVPKQKIAEAFGRNVDAIAADVEVLPDKLNETVLYTDMQACIPSNELPGQKAIVEAGRQTVEDQEFMNMFSPQEQLIITKLTNSDKDIAAELGINYKTFTSYLSQIYMKTGVQDSTELLILASKHMVVSFQAIPTRKTQMLSEKETEVLKNYSLYGDKETAFIMRISPNTVRQYWFRIYEKLLHKDYEPKHNPRRIAVAMALKDGLINPRSFLDSNKTKNSEQPNWGYNKPLSPTEIEVAKNITNSNRVIAETLGITPVAVKKHLQRMMKKASVSYVEALVIKLGQNGDLDLTSVRAGHTALLDPQERMTLQRHYADSLPQTAQHLQTSAGNVKRIWKRIYKKFDLEDEESAYLRRITVAMAYKDGLFDEEAAAA